MSGLDASTLQLTVMGSWCGLYLLVIILSNKTLADIFEKRIVNMKRAGIPAAAITIVLMIVLVATFTFFPILFLVRLVSPFIPRKHTDDG